MKEVFEIIMALMPRKRKLLEIKFLKGLGIMNMNDKGIRRLIHI